MPRVIRYFNKADESFVDEIVLPEIPLENLQQLFDVVVENPMYESFLINKDRSSFFEDYVDLEFLFDSFDYYLEYDS